MRCIDSGRFPCCSLSAGLLLLFSAMISTPARGDFSRSNGFETPAEVKRPPRQMVTSRPDDLRVAEEDRIYNEMTLSQREDADAQRRIWLIASISAAACVLVGVVYFLLTRSRNASP